MSDSSVIDEIVQRALGGRSDKPVTRDGPAPLRQLEVSQTASGDLRLDDPGADDSDAWIVADARWSFDLEGCR